MKINTIRIVFAALCLSMAVMSCVKEEPTGPTLLSEEETVSVLLDLELAPLVEMTDMETKGTGINTSTNKEVNEVKNLWILQFDGVEDSSKSRGNPVYLENYRSSDAIKLIASSEDNRLVFIANTFASNIAFGDCKTLAEAKSIIRSITGEQDVVRTVTGSAGDEHYPIMNGMTDITISSGIEISCPLKHSVARIDVQVANSIPATLKIESVTLKSVPDKLNYITNYTLPEIFPDIQTFSTVNYQPTLWADGGVVSGNPNAKNFSFYVPANMRGTTGDDTDNGKLKGIFAPDKATRLCILGSYVEDDVKYPIEYSFYLGDDLIDDYNICPNGHYSYTITINDLGDQNTDARIEGTGMVDFRSRELANSYIINPPQIEGAWRNFRIPVKRVHDFWKADGKYEDNELYALLPASEGWFVEVIWSDIPLDEDNFKWVKSSKPKSEGDPDPDNDYFEFSVKQGNAGNMLIGLKRYTDSTGGTDDVYLWSWHMWVTDYQPDKSFNYEVNPSEERYVYNVPGGAVHRYNNAAFNSGIYKGKVMMDRDLGAKDIYYHSSSDGYEGCIAYQFGRKDPFPGTNNRYCRQSDGTHSFSSLYNGTKYKYTVTSQSANKQDIYHNVPYSIHNPTVFILQGNGKYWTANDIYNPSIFNSSIRWNDPYVTKSSGKSIFDPCPSGWKVPESGTYAGFNTYKDGKYTMFLWNDPLSQGRNYYPNGYADRTTGTIFFPKNIYLDGISANIDGSTSNHYSCNPNNQGGAKYNVWDQNGINIDYTWFNKTYAFPVRCVQE